MKWRKSSYSSNGENTCVEVARAGSQNIATRDSKASHGPVLQFSRPEWRQFVHEVKVGRFDLNT